ncbi:amino acid-binding ACT domain protein [Corynebacterium pelargi]|uniref:Uncharacterized protein n=1 Tax=Corynebacterium pelargi TaxID=1471400 RepID=A0A410W9C6_9CORY|nr:amino acid-binding ACT domain protein [Corynebacterium pelargi]QAU52554.1 hypothetical protein CPELA_06455 [Corynebacterium pelargi]GGG77275.1 hypothetical protein GCM10007338_13830 [Corynebacterium pelargi]
MSYLIRVLIPDSPGSLGRLADAIGTVDANIVSVDVVEAFPDGTVMDDMVIDLPSGVMADSIISAAQEVEGVEVDSIRPFSGRVDRRGQIAMLASVAGESTRSRELDHLVHKIPQVLTSAWAILLDGNTERFQRVTASVAAPEESGQNPPAVRIDQARILNAESESWIPESWALLDSSLAAAPLERHGLVLVVGRPGGPDFLASEVEHIGHLCQILDAVLS